MQINWARNSFIITTCVFLCYTMAYPQAKRPGKVSPLPPKKKPEKISPLPPADRRKNEERAANAEAKRRHDRLLGEASEIVLTKFKLCNDDNWSAVTWSNWWVDDFKLILVKGLDWDVEDSYSPITEVDKEEKITWKGHITFTAKFYKEYLPEKTTGYSISNYGWQRPKEGPPLNSLDIQRRNGKLELAENTVQFGALGGAGNSCSCPCRYPDDPSILPKLIEEWARAKTEVGIEHKELPYYLCEGYEEAFQKRTNEIARSNLQGTQGLEASARQAAKQFIEKKFPECYKPESVLDGILSGVPSGRIGAQEAMQVMGVRSTFKLIQLSDFTWDVKISSERGLYLNGYKTNYTAELEATATIAGIYSWQRSYLRDGTFREFFLDRERPLRLIRLNFPMKWDSQKWEIDRSGWQDSSCPDAIQRLKQ